MNEKAIISYLLPYLNLEQSNVLPGLKVSKEAQSLIFGLSKDELLTKYAEFENNAKSAAMELLKIEGFNEKISNLPFKDGEVIIVLGDSSSDEKGGWVDILRYVIQLGSDTEITIINESVFGSTSTEILKNLGTTTLSKNPDWVILNFGTWDAFKPNYASDRTLVSLTDFWENVNSIQTALKSMSSRNPLIWIPPSLVYEELANEYPFFNGSISNTELRAFQEVIRDKNGVIVDPYFNRFGTENEGWNFANDGIHFSLAGSIETVKVIIETLIVIDK